MEERTLHPLTDQSTAVGSEDRLRMLVETGQLLRSEEQPALLLQTALDAGRSLCAAAYGAFYSRVGHGNTETFRLDKVSGGAPLLLQELGQPASAPFLKAAIGEAAGFLSGDLTAEARWDMLQARVPSGFLRPRSLMVLPVRKRTGQLLGAAVYGHPARAAFDHGVRSLVQLVFNQATCLVEAHQLAEQLESEITRANAAQAERRDSERRLRQALDTNQLGTWKWNADTGLLDLDERGAELFGVPPHQPLSRNQLRDHLVFREDLSRIPEDLAAVLASGGKYEAEYRIRDGEGNLRWMASSGMPSVDNETGRAVAMIGTVQDITLRKLQEESLRQSEKLAATGRMAASIAHEINNPLEAVTNLIYLAKTDPEATPAVQRLLETADSELARVSQIAQQTLGFYRDTTKPVSIDLNALLTAVVDLFGRRSAGKRLQITLDLDPDLTIVGLHGEIRQVVSNLLINAIDASEAEAGPIRIRARHRHRNGSRGVSLMISDQGTGIPHHVRPRLFTPFVTTKESRGTGLGLWVTRGMVEKHGGSVRFRSCTGAPTGTVFCVFLPQSTPSEGFAFQSPAVLQ